MFRSFKAFAFTVLLLSSPAPVLAQDTPIPQIRVSATATAEVAPDMALVMMGVVENAETARAALDANSKAMASIIEAMSAAGIEERDLQTSNFSIQPQYARRTSSNNNQPPKIVGYSVHNSITVRVRDLNKLGDVMDISVTLGANQGGNLSFTNANPDEAISQARSQAMRNAIKKAETLAEAADVSLGAILEISEQNRNVRPAPIAMARAESMASDTSVPIASGENSYRVTVNASFAIEQE